ncbi:MAG: riboflavin synthase [Acidobacteriota bacterium]|nr:riboflavin synthase [Acidobacteriota bacterium]
MFTGIIESLGRIRRLERLAAGGRIEIGFESSAPGAPSPLAAGASIAVNGCCLTVVEASSEGFAADLSPETVRRTTFGRLETGSLVNLERPLTAGAELGGHFVLGHVDGIGRIERLNREGENGWLGVRVGAELERYLAMKGSLAIDGISLTIAGCEGGLAEFAVIPYTFAHTNLRERAEGDPVNVEADVLARYLERLLEGGSEARVSRLTMERLIDEGF